MKTILFVDDEVNILNALKRLFRNLEFECYYAQNIKEAVKVLFEVDKIDMLITDIKMPEFDGLRVLKLFKQASPDTIRVALSGYASTRSITEAVSKNLAKQYFYKPWKNEELIDYIRKMFLLEEKLKDVNLFEVVHKFEKIKTIPRLFNEVSMAIQKDDSIEEISEMIEKDPAIAANILRISNSAFYAARTGNLQQAIMYIGLNNLKQIILTYEISNFKIKYFEKSASIWSHSTETNKIFQEIYEKYYNKKIPSVIGTAGLMHDIGKILMLQIFGLSYFDNVLQSQDNTDVLLTREIEHYEIDHSTLGGYFLNWWSFPLDIIEMTMYHHDPSNPDIINKELVALMCIASQIDSSDSVLRLESYKTSYKILGIEDDYFDTIEKKYELERSQ
ncbi:MAG: HDOD domain-containing protein [Clostridiales bacterium]|nr:HDOD domain-containing protein [Clostridiales bacterium]